MALPSTQRRTVEGTGLKKIWIYGLPFTGKTYLANEFDTPLMLNTDGNYKQVDAPVLRIVDEVTTEGRITKRKYAWEVFKEAIEDLEKGSEFETIIVDLLEDAYDACRVKVCIDNGWDHESDDSFKAYDIVRSEFLRTMKRLLNLPYNIVLISHEDTSRDITKKTGSKITAIKPNLQEKIALKIAGMVDMVIRIVLDGDERTISFKSDEVTFGGGRLKIDVKEIPCEYNELMKIYGKPKKAGSGSKKEEKAEKEAVKTTDDYKDPGTGTIVGEEPAAKEKPDMTPPAADEPPFDKDEVKKEEAEEEKPKRRRTRKARTEEEA